MSEEKFGRAISEADAQTIFNRWMSIKERCWQKINDALTGDEEAQRYYCGRPGKPKASEDWAFVFDRECIQLLLDNMDEAGADCAFFFHGAKGAKDSQPTEPGGPPDPDGRPTLMLFPAKYHEVNGAEEEEFTIFRDRGIQYPGTGGDIPRGKGAYELPAGFTKGKYFH